MNGAISASKVGFVGMLSSTIHVFVHGQLVERASLIIAVSSPSSLVRRSLFRGKAPGDCIEVEHAI